MTESRPPFPPFDVDSALTKAAVAVALRCALRGP